MPKSSGFLIEYQCPQCGAPATLDETERLFACTFCRAKSYLDTPDYFRYLLPHNAPAGHSLVYLPYWRYKGSYLISQPDGIKSIIVDLSRQAVTSRLFPVSLGVRSQNLRFRFAAPEQEGLFLIPKISPADLLRLVEDTYISKIRGPIFAKAFVGETLSLIYIPFYITHRVFDAVLNKPVSHTLPGDFDLSKLEGGKEDWRIKFIPALCPDCGWDLQGEKNSIALLCRNCNSIWVNDGSNFSRQECGILESKDGSSIHFPFYCIRAEVSGIKLDSYADLVKRAFIPKAIQQGWDEQPFRFWTPAFKIRPQEFIMFSRNLTLAQPVKENLRQLPLGEVLPVTMPAHEAVESLKIILASFVKPEKLLAALDTVEIRPKNIVLIYIPFEKSGFEFLHRSFNLRTTRTILEYAKLM